jgi:hypothetical protein
MINSTFFFYSINTFILIYFIIRLIKNYFIPSIKQERQEEIVRIDQLNQKIESFNHEAEKISIEIKNQQDLYHLLEKKVRAWTAFVEEQRLLQKLQDNKIYEMIGVKRNIQQINFARNQAYKVVLPQVVIKTKNELQKKLDSKESHFYISEIVKKLKNG